MDASEKFALFASECEGMAKLTKAPEDKAVWNRLAQRWRRCAELNDQQNSEAKQRHSEKRHRHVAHSWAP
jgi:hypothetical protein